MSRQAWRTIIFYGLLIIPIAIFTPLLSVNGQSIIRLNPSASAQGYTEKLPVYDVRVMGYQPAQIPTTPHNLPLSPLSKIASVYAAPGSEVQYTLTLSNTESITHTYRLTDTLPGGLAYVTDSAVDMTYDPTNHTLTWQGDVAPGNLDYLIEPLTPTLPYLDLADFGAVNLCDDFVSSGVGCDEVTLTFNLGINGFRFTWYGQSLSQITLSPNGVALGGGSAVSNHNQWLPSAAPPGFLLASLWYDADMTHNGRWHAAILSGLIEGHDVFYAQWQDAPHAQSLNLTTRHAMVLVLDGVGGLDGHIFYLYDNISDPNQLIALGYTIGVEDTLGLRGTTYAYAPCCGDVHPPQGFPPATEFSLQIRPFFFNSLNNFTHTFTYRAVVTGQVPETIINTAVAASTSADPAFSLFWATHYLYLRWQTFLPFLQTQEVGP